MKDKAYYEKAARIAKKAADKLTARNYNFNYDRFKKLLVVCIEGQAAGLLMEKIYQTNSTNIIVKNGLYYHFCKCGNQLNYLKYGGYNYCKSKNFDCKKCNSPCTGLNNSYETGYELRTVHGYCKKCNCKIEYGD